MKRILIFILSFLSTFLCFGQKISIETDSQYFLLGTLSDYMGRYKQPDKPDIVDYYALYEKKLTSVIDSLFQIDGQVLNIKKQGNKILIRSNSLSKRVDEYYDYSQNGSDIRGTLKRDIFLTRNQKLSFITGAYTRFGEKNDTTYCIRIHNSLSKAKVLVVTLKEVGCEKVRYDILKYIPANHVIYFNPTSELKIWLNQYMPLRKELRQDYKLFLTKWFVESLEKQYKDQPLKLREEKEKLMNELNKTWK